MKGVYNNLSRIKLTKSVEDYLETIYNITKTTDGVKITDLAQNKNVAKSSVHQAVMNLKDRGLVTQEKYGMIYLTPLGIATAKEIVNIHEILRSFLIDVLKVNPIIANKDACNIEHVISHETLEKLVTFMKFESSTKNIHI